ncbi:MAG TPA: hypothetical protein VN224_02880, partial [Xanthomonadales bacterium]|nr:hypothetical protein [Xanthomonadales bacterium]
MRITCSPSSRATSRSSYAPKRPSVDAGKTTARELVAAGKPRTNLAADVAHGNRTTRDPKSSATAAWGVMIARAPANARSSDST